MISGRSDSSANASQRHQARDNLTHLRSIAYLTDSPPLSEAIMIRLYTIFCLCVAKSTNLEYLLLPDGSAPLSDNINDLLSFARYAHRYSNRYAHRYANDCGRNITKSMWSEMKVVHYELFYLTGSFAANNFT